MPLHYKNRFFSPENITHKKNRKYLLKRRENYHEKRPTVHPTRLYPPRYPGRLPGGYRYMPDYEYINKKIKMKLQSRFPFDATLTGLEGKYQPIGTDSSLPSHASALQWPSPSSGCYSKLVYGWLVSTGSQQHPISSTSLPYAIPLPMPKTSCTRLLRLSSTLAIGRLLVSLLV